MTVTNISISINDYIEEGNKIIYYTKENRLKVSKNIFKRRFGGMWKLTVETNGK